MVVIKLAPFGALLSDLMYGDTMTIYRHTQAVGADGTTSTSVVPTPIASGIKCRLSYTQSDDPETTMEDKNPVYLQIQVFCASTVDVHKGDKLVIQKLSDAGAVLKSYTGIANLPFMYVTHQEILLVEVGEA